MTIAAVLVLVASKQASLPLFYVGFIALFVFSGIGNGSTYKMIPAVFHTEAQHKISSGVDEGEAEYTSRRLTNATIGIAGAIGAFGGVLVNIAFRQSFLAYKTGDGAYIAFIAFYVVCAALTWAVYARKKIA
jgi:NNP family nitrate/nitrite transporter-like MFS transporter